MACRKAMIVLTAGLLAKEKPGAAGVNNQQLSMMAYRRTAHSNRQHRRRERVRLFRLQLDTEDQTTPCGPVPDQPCGRLICW